MCGSGGCGAIGDKRKRREGSIAIKGGRVRGEVVSGGEMVGGGLLDERDE